MNFYGRIRSPLVCLNCTTPATPKVSLKRCGGCQLIAYCSKACQKQDRQQHKLFCKTFPVVNGVNVLHTTKPFFEHLNSISKQALRKLVPHYSRQIISVIFNDPKVCNICHESRPELITMCECSCVGWCSTKCKQEDDEHEDFCSYFKEQRDEQCLKLVKATYPQTLLYNLSLLNAKNSHPGFNSINYIKLKKLKIHIVTNRAYVDAKAWEIIFHEHFWQRERSNSKHLELVFIVQDETPIQLSDYKDRFTEQDCEICEKAKPQDKIKHRINASVHQKQYHMYFSSPEYTKPNVVIVYGISDMAQEIHCDISYRNMTYSQDSVLILTDATEALVTQGAQAVNAARPVDELIPLELNEERNFGSYLPNIGYDYDGVNERYYFICLRRK